MWDRARKKICPIEGVLVIIELPLRAAQWAADRLLSGLQLGRPIKRKIRLLYWKKYPWLMLVVMLQATSCSPVSFTHFCNKHIIILWRHNIMLPKLLIPARLYKIDHNILAPSKLDLPPNCCRALAHRPPAIRLFAVLPSIKYCPSSRNLQSFSTSLFARFLSLGCCWLLSAGRRCRT